MSAILEVDNLRKEYRDFNLNVSFSLERGYLMGFIGPNGAGKSTTIKLIMNLLKKDSGAIKVFGLDNVKNEIEIKQRIGFVYDQNYYYDELTVEEMKGIISRFYADWDDELYRSYLKIFDLDPRKKIKELSKGMQMKFSLIMALSHHAELIIMDEPTSGLDPIVRRELLQILSEILQNENKGILLSTHITSDLDKIADYITFINQGRIVETTTRDFLLENYGVVRGKKELLMQTDKGLLIGVKENEFGFEALVKDKARAREIFGDKIIIDKPTLEDIMYYQIDGKVV
ncbi:MAG TPA: ABC transporter ATP-binding protein [Halanaerobiales bacterium]|nr:ABC transporter ATP-binding protein [Halanaerobiales bacterium]HPZ63334.1 ABC transporter ATP-binding protein [Halanaerobiales bacterium]HQD04956.1 ABC transporter ATP-binding protein [Halanaerobiales bacterium]